MYKYICATLVCGAAVRFVLLFHGIFVRILMSHSLIPATVALAGLHRYNSYTDCGWYLQTQALTAIMDYDATWTVGMYTRASVFLPLTPLESMLLYDITGSCRIVPENVCIMYISFNNLQLATSAFKIERGGDGSSIPERAFNRKRVRIPVYK